MSDVAEVVRRQGRCVRFQLLLAYVLGTPRCGTGLCSGAWALGGSRGLCVQSPSLRPVERPCFGISWEVAALPRGPVPQRARGAGKGQVALLAGASRAPRTGSSCSPETASQRQTSTDHRGPRGQRAQGNGAGMGHGHGPPAAGSALWGPGHPCAARRAPCTGAPGLSPCPQLGAVGAQCRSPRRRPHWGELRLESGVSGWGQRGGKAL